MNWKQEAIEELRHLESLRLALNTIPERIRALDELTRITTGDDSINARFECEQLALRLDVTQRMVTAIERGLSALDPDERCALEKFYIKRTPGAAQALCEVFVVEQAQVYRIKDRALKKFTRGMFGWEDVRY